MMKIIHNINKKEIAIHLEKINNFHNYAIKVIKRYIKEFTNNPEFEEIIVILKNFLIEVIKGKEQLNLNLVKNDPEETYKAKKLKIGKKDMQLRSELPKTQGINHLITILRENPISERSRASLDITRRMEDLIGRFSQDKNHWTNLVMKAVDDVSSYHYSGFGFIAHKGKLIITRNRVN